MSENKYHIKIARDETRSMSRASRLWYKGTVKWFLLFGLIVLAGVGTTLAYFSLHSNPVPKVSGARIINSVVQNTSPHYYVKIIKGSAKISQDGTNWVVAQSGATVYSGDKIQTGDESYVTLISNQDSVMRLAPNSQVTFNDVSAPSEKIFQTNAKLEKGQAWVHIVVGQDEKVALTLTTQNFLAYATGGIFTAENTEHQRVTSLTGKIDVKEIIEAKNSDSILKDSVTREYSLEAGKTVLYKTGGKTPSTVSDISSSQNASYWFTWNKEQDADYDRALNNKVSQTGPPLTVDTATAVITLTEPFYTVTGRTSLDARIFVNNFEAANQVGSFSHKISVPDGLKAPYPVNVIAVDHLGNRSVKTFSLSYGIAEQPAQIVTGSGVALNLSAESLEGGLELVWNSVPASASFDGYHIVRSETDGSLSYPKNTEFAKVVDAKTASYLDAQVAPGKKYFYRVCVKSGDARYDCSNVFEILYVKPVNDPGSLRLQAAL